MENLNKWMQIGNPLLEFSTDLNSQDGYYWSHGVISDSAYKLLKVVCNTSRFNREAIGGSLSDACLRVYHQLSEELTEYLDPYDVTADICLSYSFNHLHPLSLLSTFQLLSSSHHNILPAAPNHKVRKCALLYYLVF